MLQRALHLQHAASTAAAAAAAATRRGAVPPSSRGCSTNAAAVWRAHAAQRSLRYSGNAPGVVVGL